MSLSDVKITPKLKDILHDKSQVMFAEGTTNAGKSFIFGIAFFRRIYNSPKNHTQFVLAGKALPTIEKMYIQNNNSFYNLYKPLCEYTAKGQGGAKILVKTPTGVKIIYLAGYNDKTRWSDILGLTIHGFDIEEINIADEEFVNEVMVRVFRNSGFLLCTCNGGDPDTSVYVDHLNKCRPLPQRANEIPPETWLELNKSEPNDRYRYYFFKFDDNPTMTEEEKEALLDSIPKGSYQWKTKILGIRGIREGVIYADYMSRERNIIHLDMLSDNPADMAFLAPRGIEMITVGQDVGGTDNNVFTLNVFTRGYREHIVVDMLEFNDAGHDEVWSRFAKWFAPYYERYSLYIKGVFIDSAAKIMRLTMDDRLKQHFNLRCYNAYKWKIVQRIDSGISQLDQAQLLFTQKSTGCYESFTKASIDNSSKTDIRKFPKHLHKDRIDSVEYGQANYTAYMVRKYRG
jgi:hypothetical protein